MLHPISPGVSGIDESARFATPCSPPLVRRRGVRFIFGMDSGPPAVKEYPL